MVVEGTIYTLIPLSCLLRLRGEYFIPFFVRFSLSSNPLAKI